MHTSEKSIEKLKSLHRGELSAVETYQQAMEMLKDCPDKLRRLETIRDEHRNFANTLRQHVRELGCEPDQDSGAWGTFANAAAGTAKMFGEDAALYTLKQGEERGLKSYESALDDEHLPEECKMAIRSTFVPATQAHISTLDNLMKA